MKIAGVSHVAVNVTDLEAAIAFYTDVLGFAQLTNRPDFGFPGAWLQAGAQQVHLLAVAELTPVAGQHFALEVDDLDAWADHLAAAGRKFRRSTYFEGAGRQLFVADPSGNQIELNQPDR